MYGYGYPPPHFGYPQQPSPTDVERGMRIAMKISQKESRREEKKKDADKKLKELMIKKAEEARSRTFFGLEWYILGILSYPIVGPLYRILTSNLEVFGHVK